MHNDWELAFDGLVEGRAVRLFLDRSTSDVKVVTTQKGTEHTQYSSDKGSISFPLVIESTSPDELELQLQDSGFSVPGAKEIARHARLPAK